ncbi:hypothetical protein C8Q77DRAFT_552388 [Trametes polyzona]|nr:hypothetical protein C8Q77DRAFT_552388 [Trametes polyzona]
MLVICMFILVLVSLSIVFCSPSHSPPTPTSLTCHSPCICTPRPPSPSPRLCLLVSPALVLVWSVIVSYCSYAVSSVSRHVLNCWVYIFVSRLQGC